MLNYEVSKDGIHGEVHNHVSMVNSIAYTSSGLITYAPAQNYNNFGAGIVDAVYNRPEDKVYELDWPSRGFVLPMPSPIHNTTVCPFRPELDKGTTYKLRLGFRPDDKGMRLGIKADNGVYYDINELLSNDVLLGVDLPIVDFLLGPPAEPKIIWANVDFNGAAYLSLSQDESTGRLKMSYADSAQAVQPMSFGYGCVVKANGSTNISYVVSNNADEYIKI